MICVTTSFILLLYFVYLHMDMSQQDLILKFSFIMVLTICHDLTDMSCPRLTPLLDRVYDSWSRFIRVEGAQTDS